MKHTFWVASSLLLSTLLPSMPLAPKAANADLSDKQAAEERCVSFLPGTGSTGGFLTGRDLGSRINVRAGAGTHHLVRHQGRIGDEIDQLLDWGVAPDGSCWFKVRLTRSGIVGWVRSDFVELIPGPLDNL
ncbi:SH3 domain-containing protein [Thermoleptolyngbya sp. PKUAC-SCTB121]|nr:SH3 domain-containing protein [Thermoleptolyngbya sp. PKUAC-SCTB121]